MRYGGQVCVMGYRVTDQNEEGWLQTPGEHHCAKQQAKQCLNDVKTGGLSALCLSLGCLLEFSRLPYLIWKRTLRATCWYKDQDHYLTDRYFMIIFWRPAGVYKLPSTFWYVTLQPLGAHKATIPHMKGDIHSFNLMYGSMIPPRGSRVMNVVPF